MTTSPGTPRRPGPPEGSGTSRTPDTAREPNSVAGRSQADWVRELQQQREADRRRRRQMTLTWVVAMSVLAHLVLMGVLSGMHRDVPAGGNGRSVEIEFATLQEVELTEHEAVDLDDAVADDLTEIADSVDEVDLMDVSVDSPDTRLDAADQDAIDALGGSGDGLGGEGSLSGGGAGASFFGIRAGGNRFAFIADVSGSMSRQQRMERLQEELTQSLSSLPDYSQFYVVLFSSDKILPPMQNGWNRASQNTIQRYVRWINQYTPGGGTRPRSSFQEVFSLSPRPDVIFFMTDGEIVGFEADEVAAMNSKGSHVTVHTIAFGDPSSQELLQEIARESGGEYRFVASDG